MKKCFFTLILVFVCAIFPGVRAQTIDELLGKSSPDDPAVWETRGKHTLRKETYAAFDRMRKAARKDRVRLRIVSGYRGYDRQKLIWERKWNDPAREAMTDRERTLDILRYSSMPGTSRHHWGTDMDLNSVEPEFFEKRRGRRIYKWLTENAEQFGFFQPYPEGRTKGYATEKWHWSYAPLSWKYLEVYLREISNADIDGFEGCHMAQELDIVGGWVEIR